MEENPEMLWKLLKDPRCEFMYCGLTPGPPETLRGIMIRTSMLQDHMSEEDAAAFTDKHHFYFEVF